MTTVALAIDAAPQRLSRAPALELAGIAQRWPGADAAVLEAVDLSLAPGTSCLLTGRNGCGKTTLLRIAAGVITPDSGTVAAAGLSLLGARREYQRKVGFLSAASGSLYARLSVRRHLELWARLCLLSKAEKQGAVERAIDRFQLEEIAGSRVDRLSMGQRQRVRLAMVFEHEPELVLLDEPRNSLDDEGLELLAEVVRDLQARGGAALVAAPSFGDTPLDFNRTVVLEGGKLRPGS